MFSSRNAAGFMAMRCPIIGTMLMLSVPPASMRSASPVRMRSAASAIACTPEEQKRLIVCAGTVFGRPASRMPMRATFMPCSASGIAQPITASSIRAGSMPGAAAMAARTTWASRSSGRVLRNAPRGALPTGVRTAETM